MPPPPETGTASNSNGTYIVADECHPAGRAMMTAVYHALKGVLPDCRNSTPDWHMPAISPWVLASWRLGMPSSQLQTTLRQCSRCEDGSCCVAPHSKIKHHAAIDCQSQVQSTKQGMLRLAYRNECLQQYAVSHSQSWTQLLWHGMFWYHLHQALVCVFYALLPSLHPLPWNSLKSGYALTPHGFTVYKELRQALCPTL